MLLVLLDAYGISMMYVGCCVFGDVMHPVVSLASVGLKATRERLRVLVCVFLCVVVGALCCGALSVLGGLVRFVGGG